MELQTYQEMLSNLVQKHPESQKTSQEILSNGPMRTIHLVKFQSFGKDDKAAIRTNGGSGL